MPLPIRPIRVKGSAEFRVGVDTRCSSRKIRLSVLLPRSPKLDVHAGPVHRTPTGEFYQDWRRPQGVEAGMFILALKTSTLRSLSKLGDFGLEALALILKLNALHLNILPSPLLLPGADPAGSALNRG